MSPAHTESSSGGVKFTFLNFKFWKLREGAFRHETWVESRTWVVVRGVVSVALKQRTGIHREGRGPYLLESHWRGVVNRIKGNISTCMGHLITCNYKLNTETQTYTMQLKLTCADGQNTHHSTRMFTWEDLALSIRPISVVSSSPRKLTLGTFVAMHPKSPRSLCTSYVSSSTGMSTSHLYLSTCFFFFNSLQVLKLWWADI